MNTRNRWLVVSGLLLAMAVTASVTLAAAKKAYQVTGPVMSLTDDSIVVQKGKETWDSRAMPAPRSPAI